MGIKVTYAIFFFTAFFLVFFNFISPVSMVKDLVSDYLGMLTGLSVFVFLAFGTDKEISKYLEIRSAKQFGTMFMFALLFGAVGTILFQGFVYSWTTMTGLIGAVSSSVAVNFNPFQQFMIAEIIPVAEVMLLIGTFLFAMFLIGKRVKKGSPGYYTAMAAVFIMVIIVFSGIHFLAVGKENYEFSPGGWITFVFDMQGIGTGEYTGGIGQLFLGAWWLGSFLLFKNWVFIWRVHAVSNTLGLIVMMGLQPILMLLMLFNISIALAVIFFMKRRDLRRIVPTLAPVWRAVGAG